MSIIKLDKDIKCDTVQHGHLAHALILFNSTLFGVLQNLIIIIIVLLGVLIPLNVQKTEDVIVKICFLDKNGILQEEKY